MWESNQVVFSKFHISKNCFCLSCFVFWGRGKREKEIIYNYDKNKESTVSSTVSVRHGYEKKKKNCLWETWRELQPFQKPRLQRKKERKNYKRGIWGYTELNSLQTLNENMIPSRANVRWLGKLYIFFDGWAKKEVICDRINNRSWSYQNLGRVWHLHFNLIDALWLMIIIHNIPTTRFLGIENRNRKPGHIHSHCTNTSFSNNLFTLN